MGVKDLLKAVQSEARVKMITDFRGKRIAIDASGIYHFSLFLVHNLPSDSNFKIRYVGVLNVRLFDSRTYIVQFPLVYSMDA